MLKNYLKVGFRSLIKNKGNSFINIAGLSVGLAVFLLVSIFIYSEMNYDSHYKRANDIYRIAVSFSRDDMGDLASVPLPLAPVVKEEIPEVEESVRLVKKGGALFSAGNKKIMEDNLYYADPGFSKIFDLEFIYGREDLAAPDKIAISRTLSEKYFGNENPLGKIITINNNKSIIITGVFKDLPKQAHFTPSMLISFQTIKSTEDSARTANWHSIGSFYTYVLLKPGSSITAVNKKLSELEEKYYDEESAAVWNYYLQPVNEIHLYSNMGNEIGPSGSITYIYIFFTISFFILLLASINYINISIVKYAARGKEIGVRKTLGASRLNLVKQFLVENFLTTGVSILLAIALIELLLPPFNSFINRNISLNIFQNINHALIVAAVYFLISFLSGLYPALYLSSFKPALILRNMQHKKSGKFHLKHALVVFQFAISVILITGTVISYKQLNYINEKDLGYDKEHLLVIPLRDRAIIEKQEAFKNEILKVSKVSNVSFISDLPEGSFSTHSYLFEGRPEEESVNLPTYYVGEDFLKTMELDLIEGESFESFISGKENLIIINQQMAEKYKAEAEIGKKIGYGSTFFTVIGIYKNFNFLSLRENIEPLILRYQPEKTSYALLRITPGDHKETIKNIEQTWGGIFPLFPFEQFFLDERLNDMYQSENKMLAFNLILAGIAIFIACLGLFALASYIVKQRTKEIGVRKVLGASVSNIALMVSKEFLKLVAVSFIISVPAAYFLMNKWLQRYVFRIDMEAWLFIIPGIIIFVIALLTVSTQAFKAAAANPVDSLKYE